MPDAGPPARRADQDGARCRGRAARTTPASPASTEELLPALIAKLGTTQLGELEVREGDWHVRLRRPYGTAPGEGRRATDKPSRSPARPRGPRPRARRARGPSRRAGGAGRRPSGTTAGTGAASASTNGTGGGDERDAGPVAVDRHVAGRRHLPARLARRVGHARPRRRQPRRRGRARRAPGRARAGRRHRRRDAGRGRAWPSSTARS